MPSPPYEYSPITERDYSLPNDANVALWVIPNIEHFRFDEPRHLHPHTDAPPNVNDFSWREYGNRVGVWRLMDIMDKHDVPATVALNSEICEHEPQIVEAGMELGWEFMGHGETNSKPLTDLNEDEERGVIQRTRDQIESFTGTQPRGWLGPARAETFNTPRLLEEEGFEYLGDFVNDDQPYRMDVGEDGLISLPYSTEISDIGLFRTNHMSGPEFELAVTDQFDVLYSEGAEEGNAKIMAISLHPYLIGYPYRSPYIDSALEYITGHDDVWVTTGGEIVDHYKANYL